MSIPNVPQKHTRGNIKVLLLGSSKEFVELKDLDEIASELADKYVIDFSEGSWREKSAKQKEGCPFNALTAKRQILPGGVLAMYDYSIQGHEKQALIDCENEHWILELQR